MRSTTIITIAVLLVAVSASKQLHWLSFQPATHSEEWWLDHHDNFATNFDFRGSYGGFGLFVGESKSANRLRSSFPDSRVRAIAVHNASSELWVVQCDSNFGSELVKEVTSSIIANYVALHATFKEQDGTVHFIIEAENDNKLFDMTKPTFVSVPNHPIEPSADLTHNPAYQLFTSLSTNPMVPDPVISKLIAQVSEEKLKATVEHLSSYFTRLSSSSQVVEAGNWLFEEYTKLGLQVELSPFKDNYSPNVIAELPGTVDPTKIVVVSAHYDSRAKSMVPSVRAPGADDDGTGTACVLELAKLLVSSGLKFKHTIRFCHFAGEEQGLVGSKAYAKQMKEGGADIVASLNADMLGWTMPGQPMTVAFFRSYATEWLRYLTGNISLSYVPDLAVGSTSVCCSDQQSFYNQGYPAVAYFETTPSYVQYPYYHSSDDLPDKLNFQQVTLITKSVGAAAATIAELA